MPKRESCTVLKVDQMLAAPSPKTIRSTATMSYQGSWQILEPIDNQESADIPQGDYNFSRNYQSYGLGDPLSYFPQEYGSQLSVNGMCDSIDTASMPTGFWEWEAQTDPSTYLATVPEGPLLQVQSAAEDQSTSTGSPSEYQELKQVVSALQQRMDEIEELFRKSQNGIEEEKTRLCEEIEANVEELKDWTAEIKRTVESLAREPNGVTRS